MAPQAFSTSDSAIAHLLSPCRGPRPSWQCAWLERRPGGSLNSTICLPEIKLMPKRAIHFEQVLLRRQVVWLRKPLGEVSELGTHYFDHVLYGMVATQRLKHSVSVGGSGDRSGAVTMWWPCAR